MDKLEFKNPLSEETEVIQETPVVEEQEVVTTEEVTQEVIENVDTELETTDNFAAVANYLSEKGHITEVPEDINLEEFGPEEFHKLWEHNKKIASRKEFERGFDHANKQLVDKLSPLSQKILSYNLDNPNADEEDIKSFFTTMDYSESITKLTVENNAEEIVAEYYKSIDWDPKAISNTITKLADSEELAAEAARLKPKLDQKASAIIQAKQQEVQQLKTFEQDQAKALETKTVSQLQTGKLLGVPLSKDQEEFLYAAVMNNDTPVNIGGKKVHMGFAEALVRHAKYSPSGNMENLMLGLLVIQQGPKVFDQFIKKQAVTKETEEFIKQHKFSNNRKKPSISPETQEIDTGMKFNLD